MRVTPAHNALRLAATLSALDSGASTAHFKIYTGVPPVDPDGATLETVLVTQQLLKPCGAIVDGYLLLYTGANPTCAATGVAGWCRYFNGDGVPVGDGSVSTLGGGGEVLLSTLSLIAGRSFIARTARMR